MAEGFVAGSLGGEMVGRAVLGEPPAAPLGSCWKCENVKVLPIANVANSQLVLSIGYWQQFHIGNIPQCRQAMGGAQLPRSFYAVMVSFMDGRRVHYLPLTSVILHSFRNIQAERLA